MIEIFLLLFMFTGSHAGLVQAHVTVTGWDWGDEVSSCQRLEGEEV